MAELSNAGSSTDDDDNHCHSLGQLRTKVLYIFDLVLPKDEDIPPSELELLELVNAIRAAREILKPAVMEKRQGHTWRDNASSDRNLTTGVDSGAPKTAAETRAENVKIVVKDASLTTVIRRIRAYEFILLRPFLMVGIIMVLWAFGGAVVFLFTLNPKCVSVNGVETCKEITYPMALYYATQAGFSVGFGLLTERQTAVRWYTIFHGLVGLTIIAAGLTLFLLRPGGRLAQRIAGNPEDKWKGSTKDNDPSRSAYRVYRKLRRAFLMELPLVVLFCLFATCVTFQSLINGWDFTTAVFFAFFALSTGGLQAPGATTDVQMLFVTAYLMIGIPLFGATMSRLVDFVLDRYIRAVQSSELLMSRQKHLADPKFKQKQHTHDEAVREAFAAAAIAQAHAEEEANEARLAELKLERARLAAAEEVGEAIEAKWAAEKALNLAREMERRAKRAG